MAARFNYQQIEGIKGNSFVTSEFITAVEAMAGRIGTKPEYVLAAMSFETGRTFDPAIQNRIRATGLIQFIPDTALLFGTTVERLKRMSAVEQLVYVEKYLGQYKGRLDSLEAVYTSILSGSPKKRNDVLFKRGTKKYRQNPLDWDHDGVITGLEATTIVAAILFGGVEAIQGKLLELGFVPEVLKEKFVDGNWGKNTMDALLVFQKKNNISPSGLMDEATGFALFGNNTTTPTPTTTTPVVSNAVLERGNEGDGVKALQNSLVRLGYLTVEQIGDGFGTFGQLTEGAVRAFQTHLMLDVTGKFGPIEQGIVNEIDRGIGTGHPNIQVVKALQNRFMALGLMTQDEINTGPGTFGQRTDRAVREFQSKNGLQQSGVVNSVNFNILFNSGITGSPVEPVPVNPGGIDGADELTPGIFKARDGQDFIVATDILFNSFIQERVAKIASVYIGLTGNKLRITSGYRTPFRQARAMYDNIQMKGETKVRNTYRNKTLVDEVLSAYRPHRGNRVEAIEAMKVVVEKQIARTKYISNHLRSNAIDVDPRVNLAMLKRAVAGIGKEPFWEENHYHIELK